MFFCFLTTITRANIRIIYPDLVADFHIKEAQGGRGLKSRFCVTSLILA